MISYSEEYYDRRRRDGRNASRLEHIDPLQPMDLAALAGVEPSPVRFIVKGLLPASETTLLTAPGGGNKTTLSLMLAVAMAARLDQCLGMTIEPGPAVYLGMEDSESRLHWMLHHICKSLGVSIGELAGRLHVVSLRQVAHSGLAHLEYDGSLEPTDLYYQLEHLIENTGAKLVALDNVAHLYSDNENDRMQVTRFVARLNKLASDTDTSIVLIAHTPKSGENFSGSTAWVNAVRSHASIEKEENGDPEVRVLKVSKGNYVRPGDVTRFRWYDHALIRPEDLPPNVAEELQATSRANAGNQTFLRCLAAVTEQGRAVSHSRGANHAPRIFSHMPEAKGFGLDDLEAAMERLLHLGVILADQEVGRYANRTTRRGLKQVGELAQSPARSPAQSPAQEGAQDAQSQSVEVHNAGARSAPPPSGEIEGDLGSPSIPLGGEGSGDGWMPGDD